MNLTPMQLFCQEKIILAAHPGLSLEESRDREKKIKGCLVTVLYAIGVPQEGYIWVEKTVTYNEEKYWDKVYKIIGLPPTLPRVLNALGSEFYFWNGIWHAEKISNNYENRKFVCDRKLLNEDGTDATLRDQEESTQNAIAVLLGRKNA